jgi:hypothetical protein
LPASSVRAAYQRFRVGAVLRRHRHADRGRQFHATAGHKVRLSDRFQKLARHDGRVLGPGDLGQQHDELIPADPGDHVGVALSRVQTARDFLEDGVPGVVAAGVVDRLEEVQVQVEQRHQTVGAARVGKREVQPLHQ